MREIELEIQNARLEKTEQRRSQRLLMMVHELHKVGYQGVQIFPYMSPSGCSWRCVITLSSNIELSSNGYHLVDDNPDISPIYSSASGSVYFIGKMHNRTMLVS